MQTVIYIIIFLVGAIVGRVFSGGGATRERMSKLSKKGQVAIRKRIDKRKSRIMELAREKGRMTNDDVEDMFCISDDTARNYLDELEHEGKLKQIGETGRGVYYTVVE